MKMNKPVKTFPPTIRVLTQANAKGFSLVEILIALTIFSIGIMAVAAMQITAMKGNALSTSLTQGLRAFTQEKVEELLISSYTDSDLSDTNPSGPTPHGPVTGNLGGVSYTTSWTVEEDSPYNGCKTVVVSTSWSDHSGTHTIRISFFKDSVLF